MEYETGLVSAILINFNSGQYLERCIAALEAQTYCSLEVIVVDNGSTDGSTAVLRQWALAGRIRLLEGANVGSSKANNLGIRESRGQFVLILNADVFLDEDYLRQCVAAMADCPELGTVIGKLVSDVDHSIIDSAGLYIYREGFAVDRGFGEKDRGQLDRKEFVDGACCAAALYRRTMLNQIRIKDEFYNESFFAFVEDVELSFRASQRGWRTLYLPAAIGYHVRGGSTQSLSEFATYLNERNIRVFLHTSFNPVARISDRMLQWVLLRLRSIKMYRLLTPSYRRRLKSEIREMTKGAVHPPHFTSYAGCVRHRYTAGRKSFLFEAILRRLGKCSQNST